MKKSYVSLFCALMGAVSAFGQVRFEVGPQLGLNAGTARYHHVGRDFNTKLAFNGQVGAAVNLGWRHWELQAAGLFAQKGFRVDDDYTPANYSATNLRYAGTRHNYRLDYLTLPVSLAYSLRADGQGLQVFGGGYVSRLLGGRFRYDETLAVILNDEPLEVSGTGSRKIATTNVMEDDRQRGPLYLRPWDAGVQAGLGYRYQRLLVQLSYTRSLRDLGPSYPYMGPNFRIEGPSYKLRGVQLTGTYLLFGTKPK